MASRASLPAISASEWTDRPVDWVHVNLGLRESAWSRFAGISRNRRSSHVLRGAQRV